MLSPQQAARDTAETGLLRLVRAISVVMPSLALLQVLANVRDYREPVAAVLIWGAVICAGFWLVPRLRDGGLDAGETVAAVSIAVAAVAATGAVTNAHGTQVSVDLAVLGTAWLILLVVVSHPALIWAPVALLVFVLQCVMVIREQGLDLQSLSRLESAGYIIAGILLAFAAIRRTLDTYVTVATRHASLASTAAAERAAADAVGRERKDRLAVLEEQALPLLRGIADGEVDPLAESVREQCAGHAAALRRALLGVNSGGALVVGLERVLRSAAARGLTVTVQVIEEPGTPSQAVIRAVQAAVGAVLGALSPQQCVLTLLAAGDRVELYLTFGTFGAPVPAVPDLTYLGSDLPPWLRWHVSLSITETDGFLEVSWQKEGT